MKFVVAILAALCILLMNALCMEQLQAHTDRCVAEKNLRQAQQDLLKASYESQPAFVVNAFLQSWNLPPLFTMDEDPPEAHDEDCSIVKPQMAVVWTLLLEHASSIRTELLCITCLMLVCFFVGKDDKHTSQVNEEKVKLEKVLNPDDLFKDISTLRETNQRLALENKSIKDANQASSLGNVIRLQEVTQLRNQKETIEGMYTSLLDTYTSLLEMSKQDIGKAATQSCPDDKEEIIFPHERPFIQKTTNKDILKILSNVMAPFIHQGTVSLTDTGPTVPVSMMRDTGSQVTVLKTGFLPVTSAHYTGRTINMEGVFGPAYDLPIYRLYLNCAFVSGMVDVIVADFNGAYDVLLGNDLLPKKFIQSHNIREIRK